MTLAARATRPVWWPSSHQVLLVAVLLLSLLLRLRFVAVPLERDEGEYAYIAWLLHDGGVPYTDAFDQKPPGVFFVYLLFMRVFGFTAEGIHLGMAVWSLGTICVVYLIGRRLFSPAVGVLAAAMFSVASISPGVLGTAANTEALMVLPLAAAAYLALGSGPRAPATRVLLCGVLVGLATTLKQVAVTDGAFFLGVMLLGAASTGQRGRALAMRCLLFVAGMALPWIPLVIFFAAAGGLSHLLSDALVHNLRYSQVVPLEEYPANLLLVTQLSLLPYLWPYLLMALLGLVIHVAWREDSEAPAVVRWFVPGWLLASFVGVSVGGIFRQHYFLQMLAPLALLAACFLDGITRRLGSVPLRVVICIAMVALPLILKIKPSFVYTPDEMAALLYPGNPFVESKQVAALVQAKTAATDRVLVVGSEPQILFYAQRRSASRYILTYPLMMNVDGAAQRQVEMVAEATAAQPRVVVVVNVWTSHLAGPWSSDYLFRYLGEWLARDYVPIYPPGSASGEVPLQVYERRADPAHAG